MATTGVNFVSVAATTLQGTAVMTGVDTAPYLDSMNGPDAAEVENNSGGTIVDRFTVDLSLTAAPKYGFTQAVGGAYSCGYAKNGSLLL